MPNLSHLFPIDNTEYAPDFNKKTLACCTHLHSDHSFDGASSVKTLMNRMKNLGMTHVTLTEHGNLNSAAEAWRIAGKYNMKVIHGVEGYIYWPGDTNPTNSYHITIWFKTEEAYEAYCKLTPKIFSRPQIKVTFGDAKPVMDWNDFLSLADKGIMVGTGCIGSWLNSVIYKNGDFEEAKKRLKLMINTIGKENIWGEIIVDDLSKNYDPKTQKLVLNECKPWMSNNDLQKRVNQFVVEMCQKVGIKTIASQDAHYSCQQDKIIQDTKKYKQNFIMSYFQHIKSGQEYACMCKKNHGYDDKFIESLIDNTHDFVQSFSEYKFLTAKERGYLIPNPYKADSKAEIYRRIKELNRVNLDDPVYKERIEMEIDVLSSKKTLDGLGYILLASDIANIAKKKGYLVNTRGSAGGCLLIYALGVSITDPIKYELQFERFITRGRMDANTPPDVDMDFENKELIIEAVKEEWGTRVIPLSIDTLAQPKSAIKDIERYLDDKVSLTTEAMTKKMGGVPQGVAALDWLFGYTDDEGQHVDGEYDTNSELRKYAEKSPEIWKAVTSAIGVIRQKGSHASGVAILPEPVHYKMPLYRIDGADGQLVTGFGPKDVEYVGAMKVDFLGVKKMATIKSCFNWISKRHNLNMIWEELPHDPEVYKNIIHTGRTEGLFQLQTEGLTDLCRKSKPNSIVEISNLIALYRPGCLDWDMRSVGFEGNAVDFYLACAAGKAKPFYIHPSLEPILGSTFGVCLFQEQTLRIFRDIGKKTYEQAEAVRRAIGKKDAKALEEAFKDLSDACLADGWEINQISSLRDMIMAASRYSFNKAHSISYAIVAYNTAWLKHHYPLEFWCSELTTEEDETILTQYASLLEDIIVLPDVTMSLAIDWTITNDKLVSPLNRIKGVGDKAAIDIYKIIHRLYKELTPEEIEQLSVKKTKRKKTSEADDLYE